MEFVTTASTETMLGGMAMCMKIEYKNFLYRSYSHLYDETLHLTTRYNIQVQQNTTTSSQIQEARKCHRFIVLQHYIQTVYNSISMQTDTTTLPLAAAWNGVHNVLSYSFSRATSSECALKWINTYQWPDFLQNIFFTEKIASIELGKFITLLT